MDISERLKTIRDYRKLSDRAFSIKCGIHPTTMDKQLKGTRSVSAEVLIAVASAFPEISRDWLLLGEGDMIKSNSKEIERINRLVDTITTLQDAINAKSDTISTLNERIKQFESQHSK